MSLKVKILILLFLSTFPLYADIIQNVSFLGSKNKCIYNDFYAKNGSFHYRYLTSSNTWRSTTSKKYNIYISTGYQFDTNTSICSPESWLILGMDVKDWHFLEALTGLLFGFVFMIFTIYIFIQVGTKR